MRSPTLTPPPSALDEHGRLITQYSWRGRKVWVRDSARAALLAIEMFGDEDFPEEKKRELLPLMMFPFPEEARMVAGDDPVAMVRDLVWDAYGIDATSEKCHDSGEQAFCWEQDAARIKASLLSRYGIDWDSQSGLISFCDAAALLAALMETSESTPFREAVEARLAKPPKPTRENRELRRIMEERRRHFALDKKGPAKGAAAAANDAAADRFAAAKRAAVRNGR